MQESRHSTKDKGDLALTKVIADLRQHGITCCLPLSEHLPFDLVAVMPDMKTLIRVQVKYRSGNKYGTVLVEFKNNYYDSQKIYSKPVDFKEIDAYAVYIPDIDRVCYFRVNNLREEASSLTLRFEPPKNNQRKGVNLVEDFYDPFIIAEENVACANFKTRIISMADEIAISRFIVYLQEKSIYPLLPNSRFVTFDLLGITADTMTITRYVVSDSKPKYSSYADVWVQYNSDMIVPMLQPISLFESDMSI